MKNNASHNAKRIHTEPDPFDQFHISLGYTVGNLIFTSGLHTSPVCHLALMRDTSVVLQSYSE